MNILELEGLDRYYGKTKVLDGLSVHVPKGKIYGFLGRNGAGKTTTIRIILGLIRSHGGRIMIHGRESGADPSALGRIGSIVEFPGFYPILNGHDNLKAFQLLYGDYDKSAIDRVLEIVGLWNAGGKKAGAYSLGMKQRLGLARALLNDPDILILDEPINGLDPSGILDMRKMLRSLSADYGKTIFLSSHILSEIEQIVDTVGIIKDGRTVEEIGIHALREKCRKGLQITVSDPEKAAHLLKEHMHVPSTVDKDKNLLTIEKEIDAALANALLVNHGHRVSTLSVSAQSLEDYFLAVTA